MSEAKRRTVALVGNPNVGKSVIFGALTGRYVVVSNYPGTTVEISRGNASMSGLAGTEVIDTPGTNNLIPMSEDEAVTRDILVGGELDCVLQVCDAKNLRRGLLLEFQLAELGCKHALCLNMSDEARARGLAPSTVLLEESLGIPVVETVAIEQEGVSRLAEAITNARAAKGRPVEYGELIEAAIAEITALLPGRSRGVVLMFLVDAFPEKARLPTENGGCLAEVRRVRERLVEALGEPIFSVVSRRRLEAADVLSTQAVAAVRAATSVARYGTAPGTGPLSFPDGRGAFAGRALTEVTPKPKRPWHQAALVAVAGLVTALTVDGALAAVRAARAAKSTDDPLDDFGLIPILTRLLSSDLVAGWWWPSLLLGVVVAAGALLCVRRARRMPQATVKVLAAGAGGYLLFACAWAIGSRIRALPEWPILVGGATMALLLFAMARLDEERERFWVRRFGRLAMHRVFGLPMLCAVLFLVYKLVGEFGARTAVDFLEVRIFGKLKSEQKVAVGPAPAFARREDDGSIAEYASKTTVVAEDRAAGKARLRIAVTRRQKDGTHLPETALLPTLTIRRAELETLTPARDAAGKPLPGIYDLDLRHVGPTGAAVEVRVWTGYLNRWLARGLEYVPYAIIRDLISGPYGVVTMALTYGIAIVLPIVAMFFLVFSAMEDSGYLPRLAVMVNNAFRLIGLNGKAVLPMILGLGCDTMATLTARIMETRKERILVTLLLALGVPCSAQLGVVLGMLAGVGFAAGLWWGVTIVGTMIIVGFLAARLVPGEGSDFLLEMPPIRRPQLSNIFSKTGARIEWYLKEALPLFVVGTLILFVLDRLQLLGGIQRHGRPLVSGLLGLPAEAADAFLIGFLRRDFGATKLFDMANRGALDTVQMVVAMTTITLFIPCIANAFMIVKERGAGVAVAMVAFIFPFAFGVGGILNLVMRRLPDPKSPLAAFVFTAVVLGSCSVVLLLWRRHDRKKREAGAAEREARELLPASAKPAAS